MKASNLALEQAVEGRVIYLLALIAVVQFAYPITAFGTLALIVYEFLYASMIVVGVIVGRDSPRHMLILAASGFIFLAASMFYVFFPAATWAVVLTYVALIPYLALLVSILGRYLLIARTITRDVLYAATAIYLLLGAVFVPVYGLIETLAPGSFRDSSTTSGAVQWQQFVYYSYTTLTTAGYGDILPISWWGRSVANIEMIVGMLYIAIVMARLVSLYTSNKDGSSS
jgi:hypothetical protein